jgi:hypothetical protein
MFIRKDEEKEMLFFFVFIDDKNEQSKHMRELLREKLSKKDEWKRLKSLKNNNLISIKRIFS